MTFGAVFRHLINLRSTPFRRGTVHRGRIFRSPIALETLEDRLVPSFAAPVGFDAGQGPGAIASASFRGSDQPIDVAVANSFIGKVSILLGNGDGTFQSPVSFSTGTNGPVSLVAGDFNNDGYPDLAVLSFNNADGLVSILLGNGDGTLQAPFTIHVGQSAGSLAVGDFNGDGNLDIVTANAAGTVSLLLGNGDGTLQPPVNFAAGTFTAYLAVGDFNGDGNLDVAATNANGAGTVSILLGNGDGTFRPAVPYAAGFVPGEVAVGDLRGIGKQDLVVADQDGTVSVLLGNGDGTFQHAAPYDGGQALKAVTVADVNGDGALDIVTPDPVHNTVNVLFGNGDGTFQPKQSFAGGDVPHGVVAGDFNGDGAPDVAVLNNGPNGVAVLINNVDWSGGGVSQPLVPPTTGTVTAQATFSSFPSQPPTAAIPVTTPPGGAVDAIARESRPTTVEALSAVAGDQLFANLDAFLLGGLLQKDSGRVQESPL
jgi:hypothetical protein